MNSAWLLNLILHIDTDEQHELSLQKKDIFKYYADIQVLKFDVGVALNREKVPADVDFYKRLCDSLSKGPLIHSKIVGILKSKNIRWG